MFFLQLSALYSHTKKTNGTIKNLKGRILIKTEEYGSYKYPLTWRWKFD